VSRLRPSTGLAATVLPMALPMVLPMALAMALATALVALTAGCSGEGAVDREAGKDQRYVAGDGTTATYPAGDRPKVGPVTGELLDGTEFALDDLRGRVVVVNFWGQWCAPCRAEADDLQQVYAATKPAGVEFVGVDVRDARDKAIAFERTFKIGYRSLYDPDGRVALRFRDTPPNSTPATIVLDRDLRVAAVFRRAVVAGDLRPVVERLAAEER
jgi:thiol-disulfide isomerase/thioredoxin